MAADVFDALFIKDTAHFVSKLLVGYVVLIQANLPLQRFGSSIYVRIWPFFNSTIGIDGAGEKIDIVAVVVHSDLVATWFVEAASDATVVDSQLHRYDGSVLDAVEFVVWKQKIEHVGNLLVVARIEHVLGLICVAALKNLLHFGQRRPENFGSVELSQLIRNWPDKTILLGLIDLQKVMIGPIHLLFVALETLRKYQIGVPVSILEGHFVLLTFI